MGGIFKSKSTQPCYRPDESPCTIISLLHDITFTELFYFFPFHSNYSHNPLHKLHACWTLCDLIRTTFSVGNVPTEVTFTIHHSERLRPRGPQVPHLVPLQPIVSLVAISETGAAFPALGPQISSLSSDSNLLI